MTARETKPPKLRVKIGTMSASYYNQIKRAPKGVWYSVVRAAPKPGDTFAVREGDNVAVLRCTEIRIVQDEPLYFAERV